MEADFTDDREGGAPAGSRDASRKVGVLIALHGHGDSPSSALSWGRRMVPPDWEVVAPSSGRDSAGEQSWFASGPRGANDSDLRSSMSAVEAVVQSAALLGGRVVLAGFSQGGALALAMAWRGTRADRVISVCGFLPEVDELDTHCDSVAPSPVFVLGTDRDGVVPAFMGADAAALFDSVGHPVDSLTVSGTHRVDADVAATAGQFVTRDLDLGPWISLGLPVDRVEAVDEFVTAPAISALARHYEDLGFHGAYVTDHPAPDTRWLAGGGHHALEPVAALGVAAGATTRIRLHTNVYVLPYRNPLLAAKALSSIDVISQGRLIAGVAAGYVRPEFTALGSDFDSRGAQLEEALRVMPQVWSGAEFAGESQRWSARSVVSLPATSGPPLWVGGNSRAAMRRAVTLAQGWSPMPTPAGSGRGLRTTEIVNESGLAARLAEARELCESSGRSAPLTICFVPFSLTGYLADPVGGLAPMVEEIDRLRQIGVDWFPLMVPGGTSAEVFDRAADLAGALGL